jgi:glycosyltransferase involved in cell wall biosynthesis
VIPMRIVIDLQTCQRADSILQRASLDLVRALIDATTNHEIFLAFSNQCQNDMVWLRSVFHDHPRERLVMYDTPVPDGTVRVQHGIELIRNNFFAALGADAVIIPRMFSHRAGTIGAVSKGLPFLTAVTVEAADIAENTSFTRAEACTLSQTGVGCADLVFSTDNDIVVMLKEALSSDSADVIPIDAAPMPAAAQIWLSIDNALARRTTLPMPAGRPRLAYISPLPPQQSGIADYSAELLLELRKHYDIHLIMPESVPIAPDVEAGCTRNTVAWFDAHAAQFERIIYHIGNSDVHQFMFPLLARHPGIVVLHDFYLSNVIDNMENYAGATLALPMAILRSHGYTGLMDFHLHGRNSAIWKYPANKEILNRASGVIVHSNFSLELGERWYGPGSTAHWQVLPLLRGAPPQDVLDRQAARALLGISDDEVLICSFGMLGSSKLNHRLVAAFNALPQGAAVRCRLVFVGGDDPSAYGKALKDTIATSGRQNDVFITGFVDAMHYRTWLQAADIAVQLRTTTRGETSASVLDCMLYSAATIVNAHGANATLPEYGVCLLPDEFTDAQLYQALAGLIDNPAARHVLGERGHAHVVQHHHPTHVGLAYVQAIEAFSRFSPRAHYQALISALVRSGVPADARHQELVNCAAAIAANQPPQGPRRLLVDISAVVQTDLKTGIQRVVRSILSALLASPPAGFCIEPVYSYGGNSRYRYARAFTLDLIGEKQISLEDTPIEHRAGDVFLGLDLAANCTAQNQVLLTEMRNRGVALYYVVYDLLPLLMPGSFPSGTEGYFREYVEVLASVADGLVCISRAVADELSDWINANPRHRATPLQIGYFHLGADIAASIPSSGMPDNAQQVLEQVGQRPTFLMVGTVEPRKGHAQALAAFDLLWQQEIEVNLVIVGKGGWMVDELVENMSTHGRLHSHLFWLPGVSDEMLTKLYDNSSALLAASVGEGFGLPLIEAAQHGLAIVARDIPVFREVSGEHAYYFNGNDADTLANAVRNWLVLHADERTPSSSAMPWLNWSQSAQQLVDCIIGERWYRRLPQGQPEP